MEIARLAAFAGSWAGTNSFRLMPDDEFASRPATATLSLSAGQHLAALAYQWEHPADGSQDGLVTFGAGNEPDSLVALWGDSWHQQPAPTSLAGRFGVDETFHLTCDYGGGWEWRIVIAAASSGLRMRMENVIPAEHATADKAAGPYEVMLMELRRA